MTRFVAGIVLMMVVTFGQLGIYFALAVRALVDNELAMALVWGVAGPVFVLVSGQLLARPIAWLVSIGARTT